MNVVTIAGKCNYPAAAGPCWPVLAPASLWASFALLLLGPDGNLRVLTGTKVAFRSGKKGPTFGRKQGWTRSKSLVTLRNSFTKSRKSEKVFAQ